MKYEFECCSCRKVTKTWSTMAKHLKACIPIIDYEAVIVWPRDGLI